MTETSQTPRWTVRFETVSGIVLAGLLLLAAWHFWTVFRPWNTTQRAGLHQTRLNDLNSLRQALTAFHEKYGRYPANVGFSGFFAGPGKPDPDWVTGLAPEFLPALPRDPAGSDDPNKQYLYHSDGVDYKIISHGAGDCALARKSEPALVDPARDCWAFGYWTPGATSW